MYVKYFDNLMSGILFGTLVNLCNIPLHFVKLCILFLHFLTLCIVFAEMPVDSLELLDANLVTRVSNT